MQIENQVPVTPYSMPKNSIPNTPVVGTPMKSPRRNYLTIFFGITTLLLILSLIFFDNIKKWVSPLSERNDTIEVQDIQDKKNETTYFNRLIKFNNAMPESSNTISTDGRIPVGLEGTGDVNSASHPSLLKMNDTLYYLWYEGKDADGKDRIYHARSSDGITWTKFDNTIPTNSDSVSTNGRIPIGTSGKGDSVLVTNPSVLYKDNEFKMWYCGYDGKNRRIFYATSPDALQWTKKDNTISSPSDTVSTNGRIANGTKGKFDEIDSCAPEVMWDDEEKIYKMWYSSVDPGYIGTATSKDGLTWTKIDNSIPERSNTNSTNGQIPPGLENSVDYRYARNPTVVKVNGVYHLWYVGGAPAKIVKKDTAAQVLVYATSTDGLNWKKYNTLGDPYLGKFSNGIGANGSLLFGSVGTMDEVDFGAADAIYDKGRLFMMVFSNAGTPRKARIQSVYSFPPNE